MSARGKVVVLGMMTKMPVPGVVWQTVHYLVGLERLGYEPYYVEAHARTPSMFMETEHDDGSGRAAAFIGEICRRFGFAGRWCYHALHEDGRCFGLSRSELRRLYRSASVLINMHGGTQPLPEHSETGRLVYLETDPVQLQTELHYGLQETIDFLDAHCAFFTFASNYGQPDCRLPVSDRFQFLPTRQPVVLDLWRPSSHPGDAFTTIGSWHQPWREVTYEGETYSWSKHREFPKFLELPSRVDQRFELALAGCEGDEKAMLEEHGWLVFDPAERCGDIDSYQNWIRGSRAEFTVAKDQNVRLRTGWFSDRSATYLAAGRPVVTQDTGFGSTIPTGEGLFGYSTIEEASAAVEAVNARYELHSAAAHALAREHFDAERVLGEMLAELDLSRPAARAPSVEGPIPDDLDLTVVSRRPLRLHDETVAKVVALEGDAGLPRASVIVVTLDNAVSTKLCLESVLANTKACELVVVDNASDAETRAYLEQLEARHGHVRVLWNDENRGFAPAANQGLALSAGKILVLLNPDTVVPPGWLERLAAHLDDSELGLVGAVTNRIGNEAEVDARYRTYGEFVQLAETRAREHAGKRSNLRTATMFCLALRRETFDRVGPLDERFEVGLLEDDDYSERARRAGYAVVCAEDVLVHHFGEASFGKLVPTGEYNRLLAANKERFEEKWGVAWQPYERRPDAAYAELVERVRELVLATVPEDGTVLVVSAGDDDLLSLDGRRAWHFPQSEGGVFAGRYPAHGDEAVAELEALREQGAEYVVFPETSSWWLDFYGSLRHHLEQGATAVAHREGVCVIYRLQPRGSSPESRPPVCVLGPLRSGTSLVAGMVEALGVYLGPPEEMLEPGEANPTGFREHRKVIELNDEILALFGGTWHHPPELGPGWERSPELDDLRARATDLVEELGVRAPWGWKDPRTCLTLPFWQSVVPSLAHVVCVRNPLDSAGSLAGLPWGQRRFEAPYEDALHVWQRYTHDALRHTEFTPRLILFSDDLVRDWPAELQRLGFFLGITDVAGAESAVGELVDPGLWHRRGSEVEVGADSTNEAAAAALAFYESLRKDQQEKPPALAVGGEG